MDHEDLSEVLSEFARTMVTNFPIQAILDHLVKRIVDVLPITAAGVTLITPGYEPRYVAASDASALRYEQLQTGLGEGPCLLAYSSGASVSVPDLLTETRFPEFVPLALDSGLMAVFTFPLGHEDMSLGALDLYRDVAGPMEQGSMVAAQTLADVAAAYLMNAQARADLQEASARSREAALHDSLTGLPNRALILELLEHAFRAGARSEEVSAVFFVDLDRFKDVNDTYGHQVGDELLVAVARRLTGLLRPGDSLARLSGDEFVIVCEGLDEVSVVDPIALRLHHELTRPFRLSSCTVKVTASIGVAFTGEGVDSAEELLRDADLAMYQTKRDRIAGRDVLDLRRLHIAGRQANLARSLPGAIERGEMHLDYQPIVDANNCIIGVEALLRWTHPVRGPIPPAVFIPFAEQSGQIVELGKWALEQACLDRRRWERRGIMTTINVSVHQFMSGDFVRTARDIFAGVSTDPSSIALEVTESVFVSDEKRAVVVFEQLKALGVNLALDDFGTGYSSLGYLNALPVDTIKIDPTFIAAMGRERGTYNIVAAMIGLAHSIGMTVICEGVETAEQSDQLKRLGADACQGFYFGRPMRAPDVDALIGSDGKGGSRRLQIPRQFSSK